LNRIRTSALAFLAFSVASCGYLQAQQQERAAQQQAIVALQFNALLAESPEGSLQQLSMDESTRKTLTPAQTEALNDSKLGVPLTSDEQKAIASLTQDQLRALARLAAQEEWLKQGAAQAQAQSQQERAIEAQEAQASALNRAMQPQPSTTDCIDTYGAISCTTRPSGSDISDILRNLGH
jgi:hypothetical protein